MIIHCSQKLAARLPAVSSTPLAESSPLGSWHGHLFTLDRRQCVLFVHDETRYALCFAGLRKEDFAALGERCFRPLFLATLARFGCPDAQVRKAELALGPLRFDTATDRSVQGSLRIVKQDLDYCACEVADVLDLNDPAVSCKPSDRPAMAHGKLLWPKQAMLEAVGRL